MVRVSAVVGVCRTLSYYWEMIPAAVIKTLVSKMVQELAWDCTAVNVRVSVVQVSMSNVYSTVRTCSDVSVIIEL